MSASTPEPGATSGAISIFVVALRLGLTSFGGPIAHLEYFRREYVERRQWVDDSEFVDLVTMSQVLPGPASSQLGMAIGMRRAGITGLVAAWFGFTAPSAVLMTLAGVLATKMDMTPWLHGLKLAAIAVVIAAVIALARSVIVLPIAGFIAALAFTISVLAPFVGTQVLVIALGALVGRWRMSGTSGATGTALRAPVSWLAVGLFALPLVLLPFASAPLLRLVDAMYRSGALVFGGGHVVLPLLEASLVREGLIDADTFLSGYGLAQVMPGPLFTFGAYVGAVMAGPLGAVLATLAIFAPAALLVVAVLPHWARLRAAPRIRGAMNGANAAVVGLLASVPFLPITRSAIISPWDLILIVAALIALVTKRVPVLLVVVATAGLGLLTAQ